MENKEDITSKRKYQPAMTFKQAQQFVLNLPDGYNIEFQNARSLDGRARVSIRWRRKQDPPPLYERSYSVEPILDDELQLLKTLYKNKLLINRTRDLAVMEARNLVDDLADKFTGKLNKISDEMNILKRGVEEVNQKLLSLLNTKEKVQEPRGEMETDAVVKKEKKERKEKVPPIALSEVFSSILESGSRVEEVESRGITRYVPVNPIIAMYYGLMRKAYGYTGTLEQFITECLVQLFKLYKKEIALIEYG